LLEETSLEVQYELDGDAPGTSETGYNPENEYINLKSMIS
jgi:hypothetical protein